MRIILRLEQQDGFNISPSSGQNAQPKPEFQTATWKTRKTTCWSPLGCCIKHHKGQGIGVNQNIAGDKNTPDWWEDDDPAETYIFTRYKEMLREQADEEWYGQPVREEDL